MRIFENMKRILFYLAFLFAPACVGTVPDTAPSLNYRNPIIAGFHPDPSVCRAGEDYYIVNSSFQYFPSVPIYHSRDLVHWELIGNVLDRESQLPLEQSGSWNGIYAPTLRYHDGLFYMVTTNTTIGRNFYVTAKDPAGPWSDPVYLEQAGIDPSFLFEDGKCYFLSNPGGQITLCEIDPATGRQLTPSVPVWNGTGGRFPEGPHLYKIGKWYYLLISEGGTELAHSLTIARSRHPYGPYEACPSNPILTHCNHAGEICQIQGTGHGDLVQAADGSWWMVFLAYRNFGGSYHHLGRETYLAPVQWKKAWPVVNGGLPVVEGDAPRREVLREYAFDGPLGPEWIYIQNPDSSKYQVGNGRLRMMGGSSLSANDHPVFAGIRQESERIETTVQVSVEADGEAGISLYQIQDGHAELSVVRKGGKARAVVRYTVKSIEYEAVSVPLPTASAWLKVSSDGNLYKFYLSSDGKDWQYMDALSCQLLSTEVVGGFTGMVLGLYAQDAPASFSAFRHQEF